MATSSVLDVKVSLLSSPLHAFRAAIGDSPMGAGNFFPRSEPPFAILTDLRVV